MPLVDYSLKHVESLLGFLDKDPARTGKVITMSYPDVIASVDTVIKIFGPRASRLAARPDTDQIVNWHKAHGITKAVVDTKALFAALGYQMDAVDLTEGRGGEILHDLSDPLPPAFVDKMYAYDLVFDCITNQCFNVAQAWWNMISFCRVGGYVLSVTPAVMLNQGFWNVCPTAYMDFAKANGMEVVTRRAVLGVYTQKGPDRELSPLKRERNVPDDTMNLVVMRRVEKTHKPVWPIMSKFRLYPTCKLEKPL